jgi:hypothetical protein
MRTEDWIDYNLIKGSELILMMIAQYERLIIELII